MVLNAFVAEQRTKIFDELTAGLAPSVGEYSKELLKEARVKGKPQMGTTRFQPDSIVIEFIYPDPKSAATVLAVKLDVPERILFMPVPIWVIESIWQGEIDGSYHFESEAALLLAEYANLLATESNAPLFGKKQAKHRE